MFEMGFVRFDPHCSIQIFDPMGSGFVPHCSSRTKKLFQSLKTSIHQISIFMPNYMQTSTPPDFSLPGHTYLISNNAPSLFQILRNVYIPERWKVFNLFSALKCVKIDFRLGLCPRPRWKCQDAIADPPNPMGGKIFSFFFFDVGLGYSNYHLNLYDSGPHLVGTLICNQKIRRTQFTL